MKNVTWTKTKAASWKIMKAALLAAVALVSGCLIIAYAGETIVAIGLWLLNLAVMIAIGMAVGSLAYTIGTKLYDLAMEKVHVRNVANVIYPWGKLHHDLASE